MTSNNTNTNEVSSTPRTDAIQRVTDYMLSGGLFNTELAIHENVRDLLADCRTELTEQTDEVARLRKQLARAIEIADQACNLLNLKGGHHESYELRNELLKISK
jgi:hypothetical protein